jgi:hypothetical protein
MGGDGMDMGMQEPGEMCCSLANSHMPAASALSEMGEAGVHAIHIIMAVRIFAATSCLHHP